MKGLFYLLLGGLTLSSSVFASSMVRHHAPMYGYKGEVARPVLFTPAMPCNHFEIIGAFGIATLDAGNSTLGVTSSETDRLVQTNENNWDSVLGQLGVGYIYYLPTFRNMQPCPDRVHWLTAIEPQLNLYHLVSNSIEGNVLRFGNSGFNDLTFDIPVHSTRLMLDVALTLAEWRRLALYVKGGIGYAWTRASYSDKDKSNTDPAPCPEANISLSSKTNSNFVWELGAGVIFAANDRVGLSVEYLFADLGNIKLSSSGNTGALAPAVINPPHFNLKTQSILLGVHVAV